MKKLWILLVMGSFALIAAGCGSGNSAEEAALTGTAPQKNADGSDSAAGDGANKRKAFDANNP